MMKIDFQRELRQDTFQNYKTEVSLKQPGKMIPTFYN